MLSNFRTVKCFHTIFCDLKITKYSVKTLYCPKIGQHIVRSKFTNKDSKYFLSKYINITKFLPEYYSVIVDVLYSLRRYKLRLKSECW